MQLLIRWHGELLHFVGLNSHRILIVNGCLNLHLWLLGLHLNLLRAGLLTRHGWSLVLHVDSLDAVLVLKLKLIGNTLLLENERITVWIGLRVVLRLLLVHRQCELVVPGDAYPCRVLKLF